MINSITQLHNVNPKQIFNPLEDIKKQIEELRTHLQPKQPTEFLTRSEVAELLKINLSTLHNYTKQNKLIAYGIGSRVYYKREEVINSIIKLK